MGFDSLLSRLFLNQVFPSKFFCPSLWSSLFSLGLHLADEPPCLVALRRDLVEREECGLKFAAAHRLASTSHGIDLASRTRDSIEESSVNARSVHSSPTSPGIGSASSRHSARHAA